MPETNFKLFDENKGNMMSDTDYDQNTARLNGVQGGVASSALHNKLEYQNSLMVNALAQFMVSQGYDAKDTSTPTVFNSNLVAAFDKYIHGITDAIETTLTEAVTKAQTDATNALTQSASCYEYITKFNGNVSTSTLAANLSLANFDLTKYISLRIYFAGVVTARGNGSSGYLTQSWYLSNNTANSKYCELTRECEYYVSSEYTNKTVECDVIQNTIIGSKNYVYSDAPVANKNYPLTAGDIKYLNLKFSKPSSDVTVSNIAYKIYIYGLKAPES